jgi:hypothetical protein
MSTGLILLGRLQSMQADAPMKTGNMAEMRGLHRSDCRE